jgi:hypothetical protein
MGRADSLETRFLLNYLPVITCVFGGTSDARTASTGFLCAPPVYVRGGAEISVMAASSVLAKPLA